MCYSQVIIELGFMCYSQVIIELGFMCYSQVIIELGFMCCSQVIIELGFMCCSLYGQCVCYAIENEKWTVNLPSHQIALTTFTASARRLRHLPEG